MLSREDNELLCRVGRGTHQRNLRAKREESRRKVLRHAQRQVAFDDRRSLAKLEPPLFHFRPRATEMTGINRNPNARERTAWIGVTRQRGLWAPEPRGGLRGGFIIGKAQRERIARHEILANDCGLLADLD